MRNKVKMFFMILIITLGQNLFSFQVKSIYSIMKEHSEIEYIKCFDAKKFNYEPFPITQFSERRPSQGAFAETFILRIPNGQILSKFGFVKIGNFLILESAPQELEKEGLFLDYIYKLFNVAPKKIEGRAAVLLGYADCYSHWMHDILGKFIMLENADIEYDWLCVPFNRPYMKETLVLLGVDPLKIIDITNSFDFLQFDELIVPSNPSRLELDFGKDMNNKTFMALYYNDWIIQYLKDKLLPFAHLVKKSFSKKVFLSRKDAFYRVIKNEDEVFSLFEKRGFQRYCLSELSVIEQVALFNEADVIVGPHSSSFFNTIFCKQRTKIVEIFQGRLDVSFFYIAQKMKLDYQFIQTMDFLNGVGHKSLNVSIPIIEDFLKKIDV